MWALSHIRSSLNDEIAKTLSVSIVHSRLDYCNSLYNHLTDHNMKKLQRVQNKLAKVVLNKRSNSSNDALKKLHWLPVKHRVEYKTINLTQKILTTNIPSYLSTFQPYIPNRNLRSSTQNNLNVPKTSTVTGSFAFSRYAPTLWNTLPSNLKSMAPSLAFNKNLKTHLFQQAFTTA